MQTNRNIYINRTLWLSALLVALLTACVPLERTTDEQGQAPLIPITVSNISGNSSQVAAFYALEMGLFEKHGLDVTLVSIKSASQTASALISGDIDFAFMSGTASVNSAAAGADPAIIGGILNNSVYALMVPAEIQTPEDLIGKAVAINQPGGGSDLIMRKVLTHLGLKPDEEVTLLSIGGQSDRMAAMVAGQVFGNLVTVPESTRAKENGFHQLFDVGSMGQPTPYVTVTTTRSYLAANRPQALQFMAAVSEAIAMMKADKTSTLEVLAKQLQLDLTDDAPLLEEAYAILVQQYMEQIPYPTLEGVQAEIEILAERNPEAAKLTAEDIVDMSLVRELEESGWFDELYQ